MVDPDRVRQRLGTLAGFQAELSDLAEPPPLRNLLVHVYGDVDALVHSALRSGPDDLDGFARAVAGLLDASSD